MKPIPALCSSAWIFLGACSGSADPIDPPTPLEPARACMGTAIEPADGKDDAMAWVARVPLLGGGGDWIRRGWTADGRLLSEVTDAVRTRTVYEPGSWRIARIEVDAFGAATEVETWNWSGLVATITRSDGSFVYRAFRPDGLPLRQWRYELDGSETTMQRWTYVDDVSWQLASVGHLGEEWVWDCLEGEGPAGTDLLVATVTDEDGAVREEGWSQDRIQLWVESEEGVRETTTLLDPDALGPEWGIASKRRIAPFTEYEAVWTWAESEQDLSEPLLAEPEAVAPGCAPVAPDPGPWPSDAPAWQGEFGEPFQGNRSTSVHTQDGRILSSTGYASIPWTHTEYLYQPGDWRLSETRGTSTSTFTWDGSVGTEDRGDIWIHEHRDDGLLLRRSIVDVDGSLFDVEVNTYLGPDTWQLATQNGVQLEWDDDCRTLDPPTSYYADGRIAWRIHGTGSEQSMERWTYADDSWRVSERVFVHASGHTERRLHTWTPL